MRRTFYSSLLALLGMFAGAPLLAQVKPETMRQIQLLLNEKASRSAVQQKLSSQLLQGIRESRGQKMVAGVDLKPIDLKKDSRGYTEVDITAVVSDRLLANIRSTGATILYAYAKYNSIRVQVALSAVETIAAFPEIKFIQPAVQFETLGNGGSKASKDNTKAFSAPTISRQSKGLSLPQPLRINRIKAALKKYLEEHNDYNPMVFQAGVVTSQADRAHRADDVRNTYGYAGQGIRIGILSDSYNLLGAAATDVATGELPGTGNPYGNTTPVTIVQDGTSGADEGRAMAQLIHDIAPKAQLFFATANGGAANFANNILQLRNTYGCDIIVDDVGYYNEPPFQDGIVAQAVNTVTAGGAFYFSSAANSGSVTMGTAGVWEGDFTDVGSPGFTFPSGTKSGTLHNFGSTPIYGDSILAAANGYYTLQWSDPVGASANDYDLFVLSSTGAVKYSSTSVQNGTQDPYEQIATYTLVAGDQLAVFKTASAAVRALHLNSNRGRLKVATTGQTHGHSSAVAAYSVAATPAAAPFGSPTPAGPFPNAFTSTNQVENFSSDGLRRIFLNPDGTAITSGNVLFSTNGGTVRNKPDITAADGASTSVSGFGTFYGTSAAAPDAAAIAALLKSANPSITAAQMRTALISTALDIQGAGYDNVSGYGIIQAYQAMQSLNPTGLPYVNLGTTTTSEGSYSNANGVIDPGETANILVQLKNNSLVNATNVTATVTTTTSGVTITRGTVAYGSITSSASATNTSLPFTFALNSSVACGTTINFLVKVSFDGGVSTAGYAFTAFVGQVITIASVSTTLGSTPPTGSNYIVTSGQQTGRMSRITNGIPSTCAVPVANPGLAIATGARQYDAYTFNNNTGASQCYSVTLTSSGIANLYSVAYNNSGFVPSNPSTNYVAESDQSSPTRVYSFTVAAGANFTVVVHDVNEIPASNTPYTLSVSYLSCAARPACTTISVSPASLPSGTTGTPYFQRFTATGGSGSYIYTFSGSLPGGLTLAGDSLSGTPTQAGSFPISVTVTDPTGCPGTTVNYTLVIAGTPPAAIAATAGTPQSTPQCTAFPIALQATVTDASNNPLGGVNVIFAAPSSGASGTFAGGVTTITVTTDASGIATVPFTANNVLGSYTVTASVNGVSIPTASFSLTNTSILVTSSGDNGPGTLRYAISNACPGATITFSTGITQINLTSGEILLSNAINITGPGANLLTISAGNLSRVLHIATTTSTNVFNVSGLTIRDGKLPSTSTFGGAGVLIESGVVNITGCVVSNNDASAMTSFSDGGGIYSGSAGLVTIDRSSIINNVTDRLGGGIAQWGAARITITNSTIAGNASTGATSGVGYGGGLFYNTPTTLTNCTVVRNTGRTYGGNIFRNASALTMANTITGGGVLTAGAVAANGIDVYGAITSNGYNLIQNIGGYTITGTTTGNQLGVNPKLLTLANYGGNTPVVLPVSNSPVINAGNTALTSGTDQRGLARLTGSQADIGAVETNYAGTVSGGTPQSTGVNTLFPIPLQVTVRESGNLIAGDTVLFTAPTTGASGTFPGPSASAIVVTSASGVATAPTFTANSTSGAYTVMATLGSTIPVLSFSLENTQILPIVFGDMSARAANCSVLLEWKTLTELNAKNFIIQYSIDGTHYSDLVNIASQGNSTSEHTYRYTHSTAAQGIIYYRIRQTDLNGSGTYSKVLTAINNCDKVLIAAYPNPIKDKLTVQLSGTAKQTVSVYDVAGRLMTQMNVGAGSYVIEAKGWAKGMYTITVVLDGKTTYTTQVVKE